MTDLRYALRQFAKAPGFTLAVLLTLALAIGGNTAIFSVFDGVLLRPAPFADFDRLAMVWQTDRNSGTDHEPASVPDYLDFQERTRQFSTLAAFTGTEVVLTPAGGEATRMPALRVSHEFLPMVGVTPLAGRGFSAEDDVPGGPAVVLIGEAFWERAYDRSPVAVGATLILNDLPTTVIGVVADEAGFGARQVLGAADYARTFADRGEHAPVELWVPLQPDPVASPRSTHPIFVIGRLASGATVDAAQEEMAGIAADLEATYPSNAARGTRVEALGDVVFGPVRPALLVLLAAVALVLLVASANVANLLLARGTLRVREVAVRTALGAGTRRLGRQFLVEGILLALVGGIAGVLLAIWGTEALLRLAPSDIPRLAEVGVNGRVLAVALGISLAVGAVFGLVPTLQARRLDVQRHLKGEGRGVVSGSGRASVRTGLVVAQLALAVILVTGAGLLLRSFWQLQQVDPGFDPERVLKAEFVLPGSRYPVDFRRWPDFQEIHRFNADVLARAGALPGVRDVAVAGNHPLDPGFTNSFVIVGREAEAADWPEISVRRVSEGYFGTIGLAVRDGRRFGAGDGTFQPPVAIINDAAAARFFPAGASPLGQSINFWGSSREIVGVVADERFGGLDAPAAPAVYLPIAQAPTVGGAQVLVVRASGDPTALSAAIRQAILAVDPALAVYGIEPLTQTVSRSLGRQRFTMLLLGSFAAVAVLLALVGVHGLLSYLVARRGPELGLRLALGASRESVRGLVMRQGVRFAIAGLALGLVGAWATTRLLRALVFGITTTDAITFGAVALFLPAVTLLASWLPARRATRIDPMEALRHD